ncbi:MAG: septum site-determining protein MinC [Methylococcaceae bacterium]
MIFLKKDDIIPPITSNILSLMSTDTKAQTYKKNALEIKSTSISTSVLAIYSADLKQIDILLQEKISLAPEFFKNSALLIDLQDCPKQKPALDLSALIELLYAKKLIPIGISGGNAEQNKIALSFKIPVHTIRGATLKNSSNKKDQLKIVPPIEEDTKTEVDSSSAPLVENMLIAQPIRSGQRIYAKGDLTILSHVGAGAEIMAEGSIHIYGALRGRALAGVQGNTESRIFCTTLEAELISIAGTYKISEEIDKDENTKPVQIYLQKKSLIIEKL